MTPDRKALTALLVALTVFVALACIRLLPEPTPKMTREQTYQACLASGPKVSAYSDMPTFESIEKCVDMANAR